MSSKPFVDRVFRNLPSHGGRYAFSAWQHTGKTTKEGVGILPGPVDVDAVVSRLMDVDRYVGNIDFVEQCRSIKDPAFEPPAAVRFYQAVKIPIIGRLHHELVLEDLGERDGWRVLAWFMHPASERLSDKDGVRSEYNDGAWLIRPDALAYALSSAPKKSDVGRLKFAALTKGADAGASPAIRSNIEGILKWARRG